MTIRPLATVVAAAVALAVTAAADDDVSPVQVRLPAGFSAPLPSVRAAGPVTKLLVIGFLRVANRSRVYVLDVGYDKFALVADDGTAYPVSPLTKELSDALAETTLPSGQSESGTLAFEVPRGLTRATLNFHADQFDAEYPSY